MIKAAALVQDVGQQLILGAGNVTLDGALIESILCCDFRQEEPITSIHFCWKNRK